MKRFIIIFFVIICFFPLYSFSQLGGSSVYQSLNLPNSARISALGGTSLSISDDDLTLSLANPSLLTKNMNNQLALSFVNYFAGINYGFAAYSKYFEKLGTLNTGIQYVDYGKFIQANEMGQITGEFSANDIVFNVGWAKPLDSSFNIGTSVKTIYSTMYEYHSFGIAVDIGITYHHEKKGLSISLLTKNLGREIKSYREGNKEPIPFELLMAMSKKLKHVPLRFSIVAQHLEKSDLTFINPNNPEPTTAPLTGEPLPPRKFLKFADKAMRHFVVGGEFIPSKFFSIRIGYNYMRRKEMLVNSKLSTVGFSWGVGIRVTKFYISYARSKYHLVGSPNTITISTNLSNFIGKK